MKPEQNAALELARAAVTHEEVLVETLKGLQGALELACRNLAPGTPVEVIKLIQQGIGMAAVHRGLPSPAKAILRSIEAAVADEASRAAAAEASKKVRQMSAPPRGVQ